MTDTLPPEKQAAQTASETPAQAAPDSAVSPSAAPPPEPHPGPGRLLGPTGRDGGNRLDQLMVSHPLPTWRPFAWIVMLLFASFVLWAWQAQLDEVSVAPGEVVPQGNVKIIQHLEGGIITELFVDEGDAVKAGAPLVRLALPTTAMNREELLVRLDGLRLTKARLQAEASSEPLAFPEEEGGRRPELVETERRAFEARMTELESTLDVLREQRVQKEKEMQELHARLTAASKSLEISEERFRISQGLLRDGLTHRLAHLDISAQIESFRGEIESLGPAIEQAEAAIKETTQREREIQLGFRREALEGLGEVERQIAATLEQMVRADDQQGRTLIRSPNDGVVKNIKHTTLGGVVGPAEPIMEIVPVEDTLIIAARLDPMDRGYVTAGQNATVKISTYDYARYGGLEGTVSLVAPDTTIDEEGKAHYRVLVATDKAYLGEEEGEYPIRPGMQATVDIHTGNRSVLDYLIRPVLKMRHEAFRER